MRAWEEKAERVWKSWPTAMLLCGIAAGAAIWAWCTLPAPGISIAILGLVAAATRKSIVDADYIDAACC